MEGQRKVRRTSDGECHYCHGAFGKAGMARHLEACPRRRAALETAPPGAKKGRMFHLAVAGRDRPGYWMNLEMPAKTTLEDLDDFLRDEWLECCGHMSAFTIGGYQYVRSLGGDYREPGDRTMGYSLDKVLSPGMSFRHEYDFGTTTELVLRVISERVGDVSGKEVAIMARNFAPDLRCKSCGGVATQICGECMYEEGGLLCDACAEEHECGEEMLLPVVNSPRVGMCAYTG